MTTLSDSLMMAAPERESENVARVGWTGEKEVDEEMADFGECQGDERYRLSLKAVRAELVVVGGPFFCSSWRGSRPWVRRTARKA